MRSFPNQTTRLISRLSRAALAVGMFPILVHGQTSASVQLPFAGIDESLMHKADSLLVSPAGENQTGRKTLGREAERADASQARSADHPRTDGRKANIATVRLEQSRPLVTPILEQEGVPSELAAVILVESGGDPLALSPKGARGLWQLMPETARRYGLVVDSTTDQRVDLGRSTRAAARYLRDLYAQFGSWPLALAAYNTGEQNLQRAIDRTRSNEFAVLSSSGVLPLETINYVPAVLAAMGAEGRTLVLNKGHNISSTNIVFALESN